MGMGGTPVLSKNEITLATNLNAKMPPTIVKESRPPKSPFLLSNKLGKRAEAIASPQGRELLSPKITPIEEKDENNFTDSKTQLIQEATPLAVEDFTEKRP